MVGVALFGVSDSSSESSDDAFANMLATRVKGVKRNEGMISDERPTKTPRIDAEVQVQQAKDEIPGPGQSEEGQAQPIPLNSVRYYGKIETYGMSRLRMDFEGETGRKLKQSFIDDIRNCPMDVELICDDGGTFAHRLVLMRVSKYFAQVFSADRATESVTLVGVSITQLSRALELIYSGATIVQEGDENDVQELLNLLEIKMKLERKQVTEVDLDETMGEREDTFQEAEVAVTIKVDDDNFDATATAKDNETDARIVEANANHDDDDQKMRIVEENGNQLEPAKAPKINDSTVENLDEMIDDHLGSSMDDETETGAEVAVAVVETAAFRNHQGYRAGPYSQPQEMETEASDSGSDSEVDEESDNDNDSQVEVNKENDPLPSNDDNDDNDDDDRHRNHQENGQDKYELIDLTSDNEEDTNGNRNDSDDIAAGPGQFDLDLHEPLSPSQGHCTLNGKQIRWHLMETLPSLTSAELRSERMSVFTLNVIKRSRRNLQREVRNLFKSLPANSLEKRLGMMAVQCENYKEIDLVEILQPSSKRFSDADTQNKLLLVDDVELVGGTPSEGANVVRRKARNNSNSKPLVALKEKMLRDEDARYNLNNFEKIIYGNMSTLKQNKLLKIGEIEGLEDRAKALIKTNVGVGGGRIVTIHRFMGPHFGWHEDYQQRVSDGVNPEIGGIGWDVWSQHRQSQSDVFIFNLTGTQILFPMLVKDLDSAKKVVADQIGSGKQPLSCHGVAVSPKCLLQNKISCFPVVQKPGVLIYKYNGQDTTRICGISKVRLEMGAEIEL